MTEFKDMNLKPELKESLKKIGFTSTTEVQGRAIPELLQGKDVIARAKTGTGKTAAFIVPILQFTAPSRGPEAIVIVPTRELAHQVAEFAKKVGNPLHIRTTVVYGGISINNQIHELQSGSNIIVGTPGRLIDLMKRGALDLGRIKFLVLDEADIMLDMGFIEDVEYLISSMPRSRQMMLFSATMPQEIVKMAERYSSREIVRITIGEEEEPIVNTIRHAYAIVPHNLKFSGLLAYVKDYSPGKAIIFARTKFEANAVHRILVSQGYNAILIHGGLTQAKRERSLSDFKAGTRFLIATNVASRGLDIADITHIINFGAPDDVRIYIHRVGRTARMGKEGRAMTIAEPNQIKLIEDIQDYANINMTKIALNTDQFRNVHLPIRELGSTFRGHKRFGGRRRSGGPSDNRRGFGRGHRRSFRK